MTRDYFRAVYTEGGRNWPFVDCYGLVLVARSDLGLPAWPEWAAARKGDGSMQEVAGEWFPTLRRSGPEPGALAAVYRGSALVHVGIVMPGSAVMEINPGRGVTLLPVPRFERRYARVEYYQ